MHQKPCLLTEEAFHIGVASTTGVGGGGGNGLFGFDPAHWSRISCVAFVEEIWVQFWTQQVDIHVSCFVFYILFFLSGLGNPAFVNKMKRNRDVAVGTMCVQWFKFLITLLFSVHSVTPFFFFSCMHQVLNQ